MITKVRIETLIDALKEFLKEGPYVDIDLIIDKNSIKILPSPYKAEDSDLDHLTEYIV